MDPTSTTLGQRGKFIPSRPAGQSSAVTLTPDQVHRIGQIAGMLDDMYFPSAHYLSEQRLALNSFAVELRKMVGLPGIPLA